MVKFVSLQQIETLLEEWGSRSSKIYLANSAVAAASAISGYITDPRSL